MQQQFLNHIARHSLCKTTDKILLTVSGGVDSMVMLELFRKEGFNIGVAHCNFQLRGSEANKDEDLVREHCKRFDIPTFTTRFNTSGYAEEQGLSTQMAARKLRYDFFEETAINEKYDLIATAHNLNDVFETVLLNLTKGTGFEGLTGIPVKNGKIIRPLVYADRKTIRAFAIENQISWREDQSNTSDDYQRNFLRNKVVPLLREINPNLENTFSHTLQRLSASSSIAKQYLENFRSKNLLAHGTDLRISKNGIRNEAFPSVIAWELLKDYGFNFHQCEDLVTTDSPGRIFLSPDFELVVDREQYILHRRSGSTPTDVVIDDHHKSVSNGNERLVIDERDQNGRMVNDENVALLDAEKVSFPLHWRKWKNGDAFRPLGMSGEKKISDFLIDKKIPVHLKENVTVLESNGMIVWVVGLRISDAVKITEKTKRVLELRREETEVKKNS